MAKEEPNPLELDLAFVPEWARQSAGENPYITVTVSDEPDRRGARGDRHQGRGRPRSDRQPRDKNRRGGAGPRDKDSRRDDQGPRGQGGRGGLRRNDRRNDRDRGPRPVRLPFMDIAFIPERDRLNNLAREMKRTGHAFPLNELVNLFLSRPEFHHVKIELRKGKDGNQPVMYQDRVSRQVFASREAALQHVVRHHIEEVFSVTEEETEPPSGNFVCVCRCGFTGELLGPPNHHSFSRRLQQLHRQKFSNMPLQRYRERVETVRDEALVEEWRKNCSTRKVYREKLKDDQEGEPLEQFEAEQQFAKKHAEKMVKEASRFIVPAVEIARSGDGALKPLVSRAWARESKNPFTMKLALRPALRSMGFTFFKVRKQRIYVSSIPPSPIAAAQIAEAYRPLLQFIEANPGCTRKALVEHLAPGASEDSPEVTALISTLENLVLHGHVIAFNDGHLVLPSAPSAVKENSKAVPVTIVNRRLPKEARPVRTVDLQPIPGSLLFP